MENQLDIQLFNMERHSNHVKPQEHREFARLRRQIKVNRSKGIPPNPSQINRLRELDDYLATNTDYWRRHFITNYPRKSV